MLCRLSGLLIFLSLDHSGLLFAESVKIAFIYVLTFALFILCGFTFSDRVSRVFCRAG